VTWTTIPNKTSLHGGAFGYPDYNYLDVANRKLDQIRIPNSSDCLAILQQGFSDQDTVGNNDIDGSSYDVQSETIIYDAPKSLLDNKRFEDILKPILIQSMPCSPSAPSIDDKVLSQKSSPPCFAPTSTTSSDLMPSGSIAQQPSPSAPSFASTTTSSLGKVQTGSMMLPATIITADDLMNNPTMNTRGTPLIPVHKNIESSSATKSMSTSSIADAGCPICLDKLFTEASVEISICRHAFHRACIIDALNHIDKCPICRKPISGKPQGKSPSGRMKVDILYTSVCPGFNGCNTISIVYDLPSGVQTNYHESPGEEYHGTSRIAYLPNNLQGKLLLKRLKYAFRHGLTFQVGTSLTSGRKNQITWTSIHHKTSLYRGTHGFPDPDYISNCNSSLDALNVPQAGQC
jgi:deltex-like protein